VALHVLLILRCLAQRGLEGRIDPAARRLDYSLRSRPQACPWHELPDEGFSLPNFPCRQENTGKKPISVDCRIRHDIAFSAYSSAIPVSAQRENNSMSSGILKAPTGNIEDSRTDFR
jgi:hypothetical protein